MLSSSGKTVANRLLIGALALLIPAIAGCEAGDNAPTLEFHQAAGGAYGAANDISVSNAFVLGAPSGSTVPLGADAGLFLSLYNRGTGDDKLLSISAPGSAASVRVTGGTVSLPGYSVVNLTGPRPVLVLSGLRRTLAGGEAIPLTFDFQHSGSVTLQVPVEPQSFYYSTFSPPAATPAATATATAKSKSKATSKATPAAKPTKAGGTATP